MDSQSLIDRRRLANIVADALHLLVLDEVWTKHLENNAQVSPEDLPTVQQINNEMQDLLNSIENESDWLKQFSEQVTGTTLQTVLAQVPLSDEVKNNFQARFQQQGSFAVAMKDAVQSIKTIPPIERQELTQKMQTISAGQPGTGDMSARGKCVLGLVLCFSEMGPVAAAGVLLAANNC